MTNAHPKEVPDVWKRAYARSPNVSYEESVELGKMTNKTEKQVQWWFARQRFRDRIAKEAIEARHARSAKKQKRNHPRNNEIEKKPVKKKPKEIVEKEEKLEEEDDIAPEPTIDLGEFNSMRSRDLAFYLCTVYKKCKKPSPMQVQKWAVKYNVRKMRIKYWFENRRRVERKRAIAENNEDMNNKEVKTNKIEPVDIMEPKNSRQHHMDFELDHSEQEESKRQEPEKIESGPNRECRKVKDQYIKQETLMDEHHKNSQSDAQIGAVDQVLMAKLFPSQNGRICPNVSQNRVPMAQPVPVQNQIEHFAPQPLPILYQRHPGHNDVAHFAPAYHHYPPNFVPQNLPIAVPRQERIMEANSDFFLPTGATVDYRQWTTAQFREWFSKFSNNREASEILEKEAIDGAMLESIVFLPYIRKELKMAFGPFHKIKTHGATVINRFNGYY